MNGKGTGMVQKEGQIQSRWPAAVRAVAIHVRHHCREYAPEDQGSGALRIREQKMIDLLEETPGGENRLPPAACADAVAAVPMEELVADQKVTLLRSRSSAVNSEA